MESKTTPNKNDNLGNTLDYFNDDMTRKVVGRLMQDIDDIPDDGHENDTGTIVGNYYEQKIAETPEPDKREPVRPEPEKEKREPAPREPIIQEQAKREAARPEAVPRERVRKTTGNQYDISMYSREREILEDEEFEEIMRPRKSRSSSPEPAVIKRNEPPREYMPPRRRPSPKKEPMSYVERVQVKREKDEEARSSYTRSRSKLIQPYVFGVFFILLVIMAILILRMNSLTKQVKEAEAAQLELTDEISSYTGLKLENEDLVARIESLEAELAARPEPVAEPEDDPSETTSAEQPQQPTEQTLPTTYKVNSGDSLTRISQRFYQTPNLYEKIKAANGLTTDDIREGMVLTIPK